ncbi:5-(carboxyamino)imidazole ribonucleotide synthase [Rubellimicrobium thermophilum DSM 16684]|uniref:N5-carboxyaminoimidazole ribonucleotide synthase n=1 Tax=Rubellimicrobium thermophilum DSM 16684 TaxID=1123069 RepID=S9SLN8_9RHOB|nr:ATP-grasp domain-containing protein [Rubellimicrobium thermophilum]EPX87334.1 5-(carboxyamino)imidazole ribonucleotide synthase [Rubellimicrobium thermophilum DSM 16684]
MTDAPLAPGAWIGILGGGQLGRMLAMAAARLGYRVHIYDPDPQAPAADTAARFTCAPWTDVAALSDLAASVAVVTYEFENVPPASLDAIEALAPIRPNRRALAISRDRLEEKTFLRGLGLATAPFAAVDDMASLRAALEAVGTPAILKTRTLGYDGKGQIRLTSPEEAADALAALGGVPAILEGHIAFDREVSVIAARGLDGSVAAYDPGENLHEGGILRRTTVPARLTPAQRSDAVLIAARILEALDHVGVMGVELFVADRGGASGQRDRPARPQFGALDRAGLPHRPVRTAYPRRRRPAAGGRTRHADVEMENLIGPEGMARIPALLREGARIHLYGKAEARAGRKMGHANRLLRSD